MTEDWTIVEPKEITFEKWNLLRDALRIRLSQWDAKRERVGDENKGTCTLVMGAYKDMIRLMNKLEES